MRRSFGIAVKISIVLLAFGCIPAKAQTTGSISGTVVDPTGSVIPDIAIICRNVETRVQQNVTTNAEGIYAFTTLPVGHYELETFRPGFKPYKRTGLTIDVNTKLQIDITLEIGQQTEQVTVSENAIQLDTQSTQVGDVVTGTVMLAVGLNGRSYTDLLSLETGVTPMSTQTPDSVVMSGVTVAITPSGNLNPGNQSINGQREDANGFLVNGSDVKEEMNGGTAIIPDLDSIAEFRVLTNSFDPEYGNYAGGIVNTVTASGTNQLHGDAFEFLRNTALDAKSFFAPKTDTYDQNQFGGTIGGPIKKDKVFFFGDYQGTRTNEGLDTGLVTVPSLANRQGNFSDTAVPATAGSPYIPPFWSLTNGVATPGLVQGAGLASQLQDSLGYAVSSGEPYYTPGCTSPSQCVFPNATIPKSAWTAPSLSLLPFVPSPNIGANTYSAEANEKLRDDKWSYRVDGNSMRFGNISAYYFFDDYYVDNPYPSGQGGATIPGFDGINHGRAQLMSLSDTKTFGTTTVNEAHLSYMRSANVVGQPNGGLGPSLASQGFNTDPTTGGIFPLAPRFEGVENTVFFGNFVMGVPVTNVTQANNTYTFSDSLSKVIGSHTLKFGAEVSFEQVNMNPDAEFDGTFVFTGYQTNNELADFLIGAPSQLNQQDSAAYYPRHKYAGWYGQDSWRVKPNLTLNYGLRMDLMRYWSEKFNQIPTFSPGEQSQVFPNAFPGLVYPTDPGIPDTLVPQRYRYAPRIGIAYSPGYKSGGFLSKILGGPGSASIRAGYGIMNTMIEGNSIGVDEPQPPFGLSDTVYNGLFQSPYNLADGTQNASPYPITFPPLNGAKGINANKPNSDVQFVGVYNPQSGMTAPVPTDTYPYAEDYFLSFERQLPGKALLNVSYVGSQGHHLPLVYSADPGNPALCLALDNPGVLTAGESCGPGGENNTYNLAQPLTFNGVTYPAGTALQGTRGGLDTSLLPVSAGQAVQGNYFGNDDYEGTVGNSSYNSLQVTVKSSAKRLTYSLGYTYSKSIDQASSLSDSADPFDLGFTRAISAWNIAHDFVATYDVRLPFELLTKSHAGRAILQGWELSGVTRASTGFPVTLSAENDYSLQGSSPNGVNNRYLDLPDTTGAPLSINGSPANNGLLYFNSAAFTDPVLGTPGDVPRRYFSGPGEFNTDLVLKRNFQIRESKVVQLRLEVFNVFNTTNFFGPAAINGDVDNATLFGHVINAAPPRLMQLAFKYTF